MKKTTILAFAIINTSMISMDCPQIVDQELPKLCSKLTQKELLADARNAGFKDGKLVAQKECQALIDELTQERNTLLCMLHAKCDAYSKMYKDLQESKMRHEQLQDHIRILAERLAEIAAFPKSLMRANPSLKMNELQDAVAELKKLL